MVYSERIDDVAYCCSCCCRAPSWWVLCVATNEAEGKQVLDAAASRERAPSVYPAVHAVRERRRGLRVKATRPSGQQRHVAAAPALRRRPRAR